MAIGALVVALIPSAAAARSELDPKAKTACERAATQDAYLLADTATGNDPMATKHVARPLTASRATGARHQAATVLNGKSNDHRTFSAVLRWCAALGFVPSGVPIQAAVTIVLTAIDKVLAFPVQGDPTTDFTVLTNLVDTCITARDALNSASHVMGPWTALLSNSSEVNAAIGNLRSVLGYNCLDDPSTVQSNLKLARARFVATLAAIPDLKTS
jgi:hypothetical protein